MLNDRRVLIVDDEKAIREPVGAYLEIHGYQVHLASNAAEAMAYMESEECGIAILDIILGDDDGFSLCRDIRKISDIPVIFLSACSEETDRIIGLELGADDYIVKPFNPRELLARIRSVTRRTKSGEQAPKQSQPAIQPTFGGWILDVANQEILSDNGSKRSLSTGEARLLQVFVNHPNTVLTRDRLIELSQGRQPYTFDRSIDNYVNRIRKKIEIDPSEPRLLKTHWGVGYILSCDE